MVSIVVSVVMVALTQIYAIFVVPPVKWFGPKGQELGVIQKIFYVHVPSAWCGFLGIFISALFAFMYIYKRNERFDRISSSFLETSTLFLTAALITGSLWAKPAWGTFWTWDPRLVSMAILWMLCLGYIFFRSLLEDREIKARLSSILSIVIAVNVPVVFFSIRLFSTLHPAVIKGLSTSETYGMDVPIIVGLVANLISVSALFIVMSLRRYKKA